MGSGTILREVIAAAELLQADWGISADLWSCTSFTELRRQGMDAERYNLLHPEGAPQKSHVELCLEGRPGPVIAASDYVKSFADQIRPYIPRGRSYRALGTDGFGRSDTREKLRHHFEVDRHWVAVAALKSLAEEGQLPAAKVAEALARYGLDASKPNPLTV